MIVSQASRTVFVHVPKTGGNTVTGLLLDHVPDARRVEWMRGGKHVTLGTALRVRPALGDHFTFGFVRNPWARLVSWHAMILRRQEIAPDLFARNDFWQRVAREHPDVESFVLDGTRTLGRVRLNQVDHLSAGGRRVDFIGRTERLTDDLREIAGRIGLPAEVDVPMRNSGVTASYRELYTSAMRDRVAEVYAADIEAFGYEF